MWKLFSRSLWLVSLIVFSPFQVIAAAQEDLPRWRSGLDCSLENHQQVFQGLEHCSGDVVWSNTRGEEEKRHYDVIVIDLNSPGIEFRYVIAEGFSKYYPSGLTSCDNTYIGACDDVNRVSKDLGGPGCTDCYEFFYRDHDYFPVLSLEEAAKRFPETAVVINSDYGARTLGSADFRDHGPEGFTVVDDQRLDGPVTGDYDGPTKNPDFNNAVIRPWLAISREPPFKAVIHQIPEGEEDGDKYYDWVYTGVGGGPWIIQDGRVVGPWMKVVYKGKTLSVKNVQELCNLTNIGSCYDGADQTSVGLTQDGRWLFLAIVQEDTANLDFTTQLMTESIGAWDAMKFDGGGSSQLWYNKQVVQSGQVGRWLSQYLTVIAEAGSGIDIAIPEEEGGDEPSLPPGIPWWDVILNWISTSWDNIQAWWSGVHDAWNDLRSEWESVFTWLEAFQRDPIGMLWALLQDLLVNILEVWFRQLCGLPAASTAMVFSVYVWKKRKMRG